MEKNALDHFTTEIDDNANRFVMQRNPEITMQMGPTYQPAPNKNNDPMPTTIANAPQGLGRLFPAYMKTIANTIGNKFAPNAFANNPWKKSLSKLLDIMAISIIWCNWVANTVTNDAIENNAAYCQTRPRENNPYNRASTPVVMANMYHFVVFDQ